MMIDFALEAERDEGLRPREAIHQACLLRFRPILMTTMAALFGALPLMLGRGAGSELRQPLGIAIVGGLIVSQVLTLFTTPVIYLHFDRLAHRLGRRGGPAPQGPEPEPAEGGFRKSLRDPRKRIARNSSRGGRISARAECAFQSAQADCAFEGEGA